MGNERKFSKCALNRGECGFARSGFFSPAPDACDGLFDLLFEACDELAVSGD
jgi:hypothetical protein